MIGLQILLHLPLSPSSVLRISTFHFRLYVGVIGCISQNLSCTYEEINAVAEAYHDQLVHKIDFNLTACQGNMSQLMRLWYFSSSVNSFFKRECSAIQWG